MHLQHHIPTNHIKETSLLEVNQLSLSFLQYKKGLKERNVEVITNFDLSINEGEIVAVVGASGSGKSLLADAILGILPENAELNGSINFEGEELTNDKQVHLRGDKISLIPQSLKALDPLMKVGKQVQAAISGNDKKEKKAIQQQIFQKLGLPFGSGDRLPFELSGGMARRVLIATAMVSDAKLVIADEPTPGLDEYNRDETIRYIRQLTDGNKGVMFITHDISAALQIADKVVVVRDGETIDTADVNDFVGKGESLSHPYTKALWNALPQNDFISRQEDQPLPSEVSLESVTEKKVLNTVNA